MAATDVTVYEAAMKEGWPPQQMEDQFYSEDPLLDEIERKGPIDMIGQEAITSIHTGRAGGVTMVPPTGSKELNAADTQKVNQAKWKYARIWDSIELDTAVVQQTSSNTKAVVAAVDLEMKGNLSDMRKQITRQLFLDQTGLICQTQENTTTKVLKLAVTGAYGLGQEAVRQGWLVKGQQIDIGTTANEVSIADGVEITAVAESETEPTITVSGSNVSTTTSTYVSLKNSRLGTTSYECNGFRNMANLTSEFGGLKPENEAKWTPAFVDTTGGALTRQRVVRGKTKVRARGSMPDWAFTSLKQVENLENESYAQVRFPDVNSQNMGDGESVMIGNLKVQGHEDCPEGDFTYARKENLFALRTDKPEWIGQQYGGSILQPKQGTSFIYGSMEYMIQLCTSRRGTVGQFRELT